MSGLTKTSPATNYGDTVTTFLVIRILFRRSSRQPQLPPTSFQSPMPRKPTQEKDWDSCPTGLISQTAEHELKTPIEQYKRQRRTVLWGSISFALIFMLVGYALIDVQPAEPLYDSALDCQTVRVNLAAYCNNQIREVSLEREIGQHLINCKPCRKEYLTVSGCPKTCPNRLRNGTMKPCMKKRYR